MILGRRISRYGAVWACGCVVLGLLVGCGKPLAAREVSIWFADGGTELDRASEPVLESDVYSAARGTLQLTAALNETVGVQLALRTTVPPAGPFDIVVSDLAGPQDTLTAAEHVTLYRVRDVEVREFGSWYPRHTGRPAVAMEVPDVLVPWDAPQGGAPLLLSDMRNALVWMDVHVPPTVGPGTYRGTVEVRGGGQVAFSCGISVEVLPVALPGERSLPVVCRVDPRGLLRAHLNWPRGPVETTALLRGESSHAAAVGLVDETIRLLHGHRTNPVLWAAFPKFRPVGQREVEVDWSAYDALVGGWLDGTAFADRVGLARWVVPASVDYPRAGRNGGLNSARYARLLAAYLRACEAHFAERGWLARTVWRPIPPQGLNETTVAHVQRLARIGQQSEAGWPLVAHLPARSLRGLGWQEAPAIELPEVDIWCPPAMWYEPEAMARERQLLRQTWLMPDEPPYSASLRPGAPAVDPRALAWQAYRYDVEGIWIEDAVGGSNEPLGERAGPQTGLIYAGTPYGLNDRPVPSLRLKRLRRGLQDYELLKLLDETGHPLLARRLARQIVRWACTDASDENLLSTKGSGWPVSAGAYRLARRVMLLELADRAESMRRASQAAWARLMSRERQVAASFEGVRLSPTRTGLRAHVVTRVLNLSERGLRGTWSLPAPPPGWEGLEQQTVEIAADTRRLVPLEFDLLGLNYNVAGVYPFELVLDTPELGAQRIAARLAVATTAPFAEPPRIDGQLDDWPLAANNTAGDFRLHYAADLGNEAPRPAFATQAFFAADAERLYFAVRCRRAPQEPLVWDASNVIGVDGALPWGQDVVEILLDPRNAVRGTMADIHCLQIKPSGVLLASRGCRTDPPMGAVRPWDCEARVAVQVEPEAWVIELALPRSAFPEESRRNVVWGCNVTRLDARRGEYSSWSGARGTCYSPTSLGNLIVHTP